MAFLAGTAVRIRVGAWIAGAVIPIIMRKGIVGSVGAGGPHCGDLFDSRSVRQCGSGFFGIADLAAMAGGGPLFVDGGIGAMDIMTVPAGPGICWVNGIALN